MNVIIKLQSIQRYFMVKLLSGVLPLFIVNEYPKSGGTWVGQLLGGLLGLPFPRNQFRKFQSSIIHGHFFSPRGIKNVVIVWRDGRDVMVSWYYHCLFPNEYGTKPFVERVRRQVPFTDYENIQKNLPAFIEYSFTKQFYPRFNWAEFVRRWHGLLGVVYVRYEDLHSDPVGQLRKIAHQLTEETAPIKKTQQVVEKFSFARQKKMNQNKGCRSFLRKGIVNDWKNTFSPEAREGFNHFAGEELILLDYEKDTRWVDASN